MSSKDRKCSTTINTNRMIQFNSPRLATLFMVATLLTACESSSDDGSKPFSLEKAGENAQRCIEAQLKSPSTAKFNPDLDYGVKKVNDTVFTISSYVDSQNSFGAMVRTNYTCTLNHFPSRGTFSCSDVTMD